MTDPQPSVAVIGAGTIGRSFARLFAVSGYDVTVWDPRGDLAEVVAGVRAEVATDARAEAADAGSADPDLVGSGIAAERRRTGSVEAAASLEAAVFATSSSTIPASHLAGDLPAEAAARVIVGHPFNPPHLMPLVEVVPAPTTSADTVARTVGFYRSCGREPVVLRREVPGFVGNRLQAGLMKEAIALVENGVVTAGELDAVMRNSLGLRWAAVGQFAGMHLGGGEAGIRGFMAHLGPSLTGLEPLPLELGDEALEEVFGQVEDAYGTSPSTEDAAERDRIQRAVLTARGQEE